MSCYIQATNERLYAATEAEFGRAATFDAQDRVSFRSLKVKESAVRTPRRDKTGSRTRPAPDPQVRMENTFDLQCYFAARDPENPLDAAARLVGGALGGESRTTSGLTAAAVGSISATLSFGSPHGLAIGQGLCHGGQLRFVKAVPDALSVLLSAPFDNAIGSGSALGTCTTFYPGDKPRSLTLGDYWDPAGSLDRVLAGSVTDEMEIALNGDFHGARFRGVVREVLASNAFAPGESGLNQFPPEPSPGNRHFQLIPGHIGRLFLGGTEFHLLSLTLRMKNSVDARAREFGLGVAPCYSADVREVSVQFSLYASNADAVASLYTATRQRQEADLTIQLGNRPGQLTGIYLPRFIPEFPEISDADSRVLMMYPGSLAYGVVNDEISVAFG
ncbi:MAG: hypothetical protein LC114_21175 [Bryobacterales bacterium]|nr:hypothetical protein [Bryobacterales bacterium]